MAIAQQRMRKIRKLNRGIADFNLGEWIMKKTFCFCLTLVFTILLWAGPSDRQVEGILDQYFLIHSSLAKDSTQGVDNAAKKIANLATKVGATDPQIQKLFAQVEKAANQIQGKDLKQTRDQFFELSKPLLVYLNQFYSGNKTYYRYFCSMAKKGWIQPHKGASNPYMGSAMPTCGDLIS
jgi:hypothetical protein